MFEFADPKHFISYLIVYIKWYYMKWYWKFLNLLTLLLLLTDSSGQKHNFAFEWMCSIEFELCSNWVLGVS